MAFKWTNNIGDDPAYGVRLTDDPALSIHDEHIQELKTNIDDIRSRLSMAGMGSISANIKQEITFVTGTNLATNGVLAFSGGSLTGWTTNADGTNTITEDTTYYVSGSSSAKLDGPSAYIQQTISVKPARLYQLQVSMRPHWYAPVTCYLQIISNSKYYNTTTGNWDSTTHNNTVVSHPEYRGLLTADFTTHSIIFNTPAATPLTATIRIQMGEANSPLYIDNVQLYASTSVPFLLRDALDEAMTENTCTGHCNTHYSGHKNTVNNTYQNGDNATVQNANNPGGCTGDNTAYNVSVLTGHDSNHKTGDNTTAYNVPHNSSDLTTNNTTYNGSEDYSFKSNHYASHCTTNYAANDSALNSGHDNAHKAGHDATHNLTIYATNNVNHLSGDCSTDYNGHNSNYLNTVKSVEYATHDTSNLSMNNASYCSGENSSVNVAHNSTIQSTFYGSD